MTEKESFIKFLLALENDEDLFNEFLDCKSSTLLKDFFARKNYDVSDADCDDLYGAMQRIGIERGRIPPAY